MLGKCLNYAGPERRRPRTAKRRNGEPRDPAGYCKISNRSGISLMEAVVAVTIVGLTAVSALEAVGGDLRTAERSRRAIEVEALAQARLEYMDLLSDRELQSLPDSVETGKFAPPLDEYSWKASSTPLSDQAGVYDVRVAIDWPTGSYLVKTYQYRQPQIVTRR